MGVDYYPCPFCDEVYCDCGDYSSCGVCGTNMCIDCGNTSTKVDMCTECGSEFGEDDDICCEATTSERVIKCKFCTGEKIPAEKFIKFLLKKLGMTREEAKQEYIKSMKSSSS